MLNMKNTVFKCQIVASVWITRVIDNWAGILLKAESMKKWKGYMSLTDHMK